MKSVTFIFILMFLGIGVPTRSYSQKMTPDQINELDRELIDAVRIYGKAVEKAKKNTTPQVKPCSQEFETGDCLKLDGLTYSELEKKFITKLNDSKVTSLDWEAMGKELESKYGLDTWKSKGYAESLRYSSEGKYKMQDYYEVLYRKSDAIQKNVFKSVYDLKASKSSHDPYLTLAISFRESGGKTLSVDETLFDSYGQGGLDYLGKHAADLIKNGDVPPGYGKTWDANKREGKNEHDFVTYPTKLPQKELIVAYGAWLNFMEKKLLNTAVEFGYTEEEMKALDKDTYRALMAVTFGGANGSECTSTSDGSCAMDVGYKSFGLRSVLSYLKKNNLPLSDIFKDKNLLKYERTRKAVVWSLNTHLLEKAFCLK